MKTHGLIIFLLCTATGICRGNDWQTGDLIFQEPDSTGGGGAIGRAIQGVTTSVADYHFTHVGMVYVDEQDSVYVIEATHPRVALTTLSEFLCRPGKHARCPKSVVFRLDEAFLHCIPQAVEVGLKLVGKEYDDAYTLNDDKYYCSELIYEMLLQANDNVPVFPLNVMTFKSSATGEFLPEWVEHYKRLGQPIPEGKPGINPGAMSRSEKLKIVSSFNH